jgi:hypothetical protein
MRKKMAKKRREEQQRREQLSSSHGGLNNQERQNQAKKGKKKVGDTLQNKADNGEGDVQIPAKLKDVIEDSDDDYPLFFEDTEELLEMFATLEE